MSSSKESKRSKKSAKGKKESEQEQQSEADSEMLCFKPVPSNFLSDLSHAIQEYQQIWCNKDESGNVDQGPYLDMIEAEKTKEIENEIRLGVDQALRSTFQYRFNDLKLQFSSRANSRQMLCRVVFRSGVPILLKFCTRIL